MKKRLIENLPPTPPHKKTGKAVSAQYIDDYVVLNTYNNNKLTFRYAVSLSRGEYGTLDPDTGVWHTEKFNIRFNCDRHWYWYTGEKGKNMPKKAREELAEVLSNAPALSFRRHGVDPWYILECIEDDYNQNRREKTEQNRLERVRETMSLIPPAPNMAEKLYSTLNSPDFAFWDKESERWHLSCCRKARKRIGKGKIRHNDRVKCPVCGKELQAKKLGKSTMIFEERTLLIDATPLGAALRYFTAAVSINGDKKSFTQAENVRILLDDSHKPVYWRQYREFDNRSNPAGHRDYNYPTYVYVRGDIEEALKGSSYEAFANAFEALEGRKAIINSWLYERENDRRKYEKHYKKAMVLEYLAKGRFYGLIEGLWPDRWWDEDLLDLDGTTLEEVLKLKDRQKINRLRDRNGDYRMLAWLRWSDRRKTKLPDVALDWFVSQRIYPSHCPWLLLKMSPEAAVNYIRRQIKESYPGMRACAVIEQYEGYMDMAKELGKDLSDAMVYKPRELKQRHDEAVMETELRGAELEAKKYSDKFPEAEAVLKEIKPGFEYKGKDFMITVPDRIVDIVAEGRALHHCVGATDRYFDRIAQNETYICFLRKLAEPESPFYTIEVEPGGAIRQHRGYNDLEPEIETVKPFLREWQKVIKKRMTQEDIKKAAISRQKREENIRELEARNNTRVLAGLAEDFMEAM